MQSSLQNYYIYIYIYIEHINSLKAFKDIIDNKLLWFLYGGLEYDDYKTMLGFHRYLQF